MLTIVSPATIPAAAAGEPAWTAPTLMPMVGSPSSAMPVKIDEGQQDVHRDAGDEDEHLRHVRCAENERGSSAPSPSSPSSFTKPPMGSQLSV